MCAPATLKMLKRGLNFFYAHLENKLRRGLRTGEDLEYKKLLNIRLLPPIISLAICGDKQIGSNEWKTVRYAALHAVLKYCEELTSDIEDFIYEKIDPREDLAKRAYSVLRDILEGDLSKARFIRFQIFEVGGKQDFIRRTGGFMDMRGASAMIDIAAKIAGDAVSRFLGKEFLIVDEAGETVFLSSPKFAVDIEGKILDELLRRCSLLDVLSFRSNGRRGVDVSPSDLFNNLGDVYLSALLSVKDLNISSDREEIEPSRLCRSCRQEKILDEEEVKKLLEKFVNSEHFEEVYDSIVREIGPYLCKTCFSSRLFGKALSDVLNDREYCYKEDFVKCVKEASAFDVFRKSEKNERFERKRFILSLDDYNYDEKNAIIALVYGDGDGFGYLKSRVKSLEDFYLLSLFFSEIMRSGILAGVHGILEIEEKIQEIKKKLTGRYSLKFYFPLTPLYIAGDDFLLAIRGEYIPNFVESFYQGSYKIFKRAPKLLGKFLTKRFGVSMGIVAGRTKLPGLFLYDASAEALKYTKDVTRRFYSSDLGEKVEFSIQASLVYVKSRLSWSLVKRICRIPKDKLEYLPQLYNTFLYRSNKNISPIYRSLKAALGLVKASDLREIMEDFLPESEIHPHMSFIKWINNIARKMEEGEGEKEKAIVLREIAENFLMSHEYTGKMAGVLTVNEHSWKWLYTLSSLLDIIEDRGYGEVGKKIDKFLEEIRGEIIGEV